MTDPLDTLRPEVREARTDLYVHGHLMPKLQKSIGILDAELLRLAAIEADALIALDCEHDWQVEHERAEKAKAELAALTKKCTCSRRSVSSPTGCRVCNPQLEIADLESKLATAEAELAEAQNTIAAQQDTMGALKRKLALAEGELVALKARIAEAPAAVVQGAPGAVKASFHGYACFEYAAENLQSKLRSKRVRLVVEE